MQTFAHFDDAGFPTAFYRTDVWPLENIPIGAVEVTEDQWRDLVDNQGFRKWLNGIVVEFTPPLPEVLPAPTTAEKLAALGINAADLRSLLAT
jgi:hypothetical protein